MRCENPKLPPVAKVLWALCELSNNTYGVDVITSKGIMSCTGLSKYKVIKAIHFWRDKGLVEFASIGRPAVVSYGEVEELECEAAPPVNGWSLTGKGRKSNCFKIAKKDFEKSLRDWAEGEAVDNDCKEDDDE